MPNHITNHLLFANEENERKFRQLMTRPKRTDEIEDTDVVIDFNMLYPIHEDLHKVTSPVDLTELSISQVQMLTEVVGTARTFEEAVTNGKVSMKFSDIIKDTKYENFLTPMDDESYTNLFGSYFNQKNYGYSFWYNAQHDGWGTKWNAYHQVHQEGSLLYTFDTAWATPTGIWEKLHEKGIEFQVLYADEDYGYNLGHIVSNKEILSIDLFKHFSDDFKTVMAILIKGYEDVSNFYSDFAYYDEETKKEMNEEEERLVLIEQSVMDYIKGINFDVILGE